MYFILYCVWREKSLVTLQGEPKTPPLIYLRFLHAFELAHELKNKLFLCILQWYMNTGRKEVCYCFSTGSLTLALLILRCSQCQLWRNVGSHHHTVAFILFTLGKNIGHKFEHGYKNTVCLVDQCRCRKSYKYLSAHNTADLYKDYSWHLYTCSKFYS